MTYDERMKAFDMRIRGARWSDIAKELNYSSSSDVERDINACVSGRRTKHVCIYPAIRKIIVSEYFGSLPDFSEACGIKYSTMYACLTGMRRPTDWVSEKICKRTGIPPEELFRKEEEPYGSVSL